MTAKYMSPFLKLIGYKLEGDISENFNISWTQKEWQSGLTTEMTHVLIIFYFVQ